MKRLILGIALTFLPLSALAGSYWTVVSSTPTGKATGVLSGQLKVYPSTQTAVTAPSIVLQGTGGKITARSGAIVSTMSPTGFEGATFNASTISLSNYFVLASTSQNGNNYLGRFRINSGGDGKSPDDNAIFEVGGNYDGSLEMAGAPANTYNVSIVGHARNVGATNRYGVGIVGIADSRINPYNTAGLFGMAYGANTLGFGAIGGTSSEDAGTLGMIQGYASQAVLSVDQLSGNAGKGGYFKMSNSNSTGEALYIENNGLGKSIYVNQNNSSSTEPLLYLNQTGTGDIITVRDNDVGNVFIIKDGGNVGINKEIPEYKLDVGGDAIFRSSMTLAGIGEPPVSASGQGAIYFDGSKFKISENESAYSALATTNTVIMNQETLQKGATFYVSSGSVAGYFAVAGSTFVVKNGKVGINISTPSEALEVTGNIEFSTTNATQGMLKVGGKRMLNFYGSVGPYNTFLGYESGNFTNTGNHNYCVGSYCLIVISTGGSNICGGYGCLRGITSGSSNISFGHESGRLLTSANRNLFMGTYTGAAVINGNGNIMLGYEVGKSAIPSDTSNKLYIDNSDVAIPLIYGDFANDTVGISTNPASSGVSFMVGNSSFTVLKSGKVGISTSIPEASLHVVGKSTFTAEVYVSSHVRISGTYYGDGSGLTGLPIGNTMVDADADTKIQVEESADEDIIRFDTAGIEQMTIKQGTTTVIGNLQVSYPQVCVSSEITTGDITTTATANWGTVISTLAALTTYGGNVLVNWHLTCAGTNNESYVYVSLHRDGVALTGISGLQEIITPANSYVNMSSSWLDKVSVGTYTYSLRFKTSAGTATCYRSTVRSFKMSACEQH